MMPYILITEDGRFMEFHLWDVADMYRRIHGGQVIKSQELKDKTAGPHSVLSHKSLSRELLVDSY